MNMLQNTDNCDFPVQTSNQECEFFSYRMEYGKEIEFNCCRTETETSFSGKIANDVLHSFMSQFVHSSILDLAVNAINNRTRERNFARLNEQLAMGIISEEDFDRELDTNEDKYVIKCDVKPKVMEMKNAVMLSKRIMDVEDTDDFSLLYSFDESSVNSLLLK